MLQYWVCTRLLNEEVMKKHIDLYVNKFSIDLGEVGSHAVKLMFDKARELNLVQMGNEKLMID